MESLEETDKTCTLCLGSINTALPVSKFCSKSDSFVGQTKIRQLLWRFLYHRNVQEPTEFNVRKAMQFVEVGDVTNFSFKMSIGGAFEWESCHILEDTRLELCRDCGEHLEKLDKLHQQVEELKGSIGSHLEMLNKFAKNNEQTFRGNQQNYGSFCGREGLSMQGLVVGKKRVSQALQFFQNLCSEEPRRTTGTPKDAGTRLISAEKGIMEGNRKFRNGSSPLQPAASNTEVIAPPDDDHDNIEFETMMEMEEEERKVFPQDFDQEPDDFHRVNLNASVVPVECEDTSTSFIDNLNVYPEDILCSNNEEKDPLAIEDDDANIIADTGQVFTLYAQASSSSSGKVLIPRINRGKIKNHQQDHQNKHRRSFRRHKVKVVRSPRLLVLPQVEFDKYPAPKWDDNLICSICKLTFKNTQSLKAHFPLHNADRKFQECKLCHTKCGSKSALRRHERDKHGPP